MARTEEVETVLRGALDQVVRHGVVLIHGEYGVVWNDYQEAWTWDRETFIQVPHCDCIGAFMITAQPDVGLPLVGRDIYDTAAEALKADPVWVRDLMNGFDNFEYQGDGFPDAHAAGVRLRKEYKPLCFEYLALAGKGVRVTPSYMEYLNEYCVPAALGFAPILIPTSIEEERPSGTYRTSDPVEEDEDATLDAAVG